MGFEKNTFEVEDRKIISVEGYWKSFGISSILGLLFGIVIVVFFSLKDEGMPTNFMVIIPLFSSLLSGLGGIAGGVLESLLYNMGVKNPLIRRILSFSIIMLMSSLIAIMVFWRRSQGAFFVELKGTMIWGIMAGAIFGAIITGVEYYHWKMKKKLLVLELENKYLAELTEKDTLLKEATKNLLITKERNHMARELHDSVSQGIHGIIYSISTLRQQINKMGIEEEKFNKVLTHLEETADATMEELRSMIKQLKPAMLEKKDLKQAISSHCELFASRQGIKIIQNVEEINFLTPEQEIAIFRIIQEALANVQKHSGAKQVKVILQEREKVDKKGVILVIEDDGQGFNSQESKQGNGLGNMKRRSQENGGVLTIHSAPGQGCKITVNFLWGI